MYETALRNWTLEEIVTFAEHRGTPLPVEFVSEKLDDVVSRDAAVIERLVDLIPPGTPIDPYLRYEVADLLGYMPFSLDEEDDG